MMNLLQKYYWFDRALNENLFRQGWPDITPGQSLVMMHIALGINRASAIARDLGVSRQAMSQMLREMNTLGLVAFAPDPDDRRAQIVLFAPEAENIRLQAIQTLERVEAALAERIGLRTLQTIRKALSCDWGEPPQIAPAADPAAEPSEDRAPRSYARHRKGAPKPPIP